MLQWTEWCMSQIVCGVLLIDPPWAQFSEAWHSEMTQVRQLSPSQSLTGTAVHTPGCTHQQILYSKEHTTLILWFQSHLKEFIKNSSIQCYSSSNVTGLLVSHRWKAWGATIKSSLLFPHLWRCRCLSVAGQHLECDAPAAVPQQVLEFMGIAADLTTVHLADYIPCMQHALPVNRAAMQDPCDHHLSPLHTERHPLEESRCH